MSRNYFFIAIALVLIFCTTALEAQVEAEWVKYYGTEGWDSTEEVQQTRDSGYIVCGVVGINAMSNSNLYLIRTNSYGDTLWTSQIGGTDRAYGSSVL